MNLPAPDISIALHCRGQSTGAMMDAGVGRGELSLESMKIGEIGGIFLSLGMIGDGGRGQTS